MPSVRMSGGSVLCVIMSGGCVLCVIMSGLCDNGWWVCLSLDHEWNVATFCNRVGRSIAIRKMMAPRG